MMKFVRGVLLLSLWIISGEVAAAKLYKIVDENGNVTFSQFPPVPSEQREGVTIEEKQVRNESKTNLVLKGETAYCGNIELPRKRERKEYFFSEVANRMKYWEKDLDKKEEQLKRNQENYLKQSQYRSKYGSSSSSRQTNNYLERNKNILESMRDLRCATKWGREHQEESSKAKEKMSGELNRLQNALSVITDRRLSNCGEEPIYDPNAKGNKKLRNAWTRCAKDFKSDIRKLENLIRKESRKLERF